MTFCRVFLGWILPILLLWACVPVPCKAETPTLQGEVSFGQESNRILGAFTIHIPGGYHAYAHDAGGEGLPTELKCSPQATYYYPKSRGSTVKYEGTVVLFAAFDTAQAGAAYTATIETLLCSPQQCIPAKVSFKGALPADAPPVAQMPWFAQWQEHTQAVLAVFSPRYDTPWLEVESLWQSIFWGFLAGILLNIMPCVLPVLSLKVSALLAGNGSESDMRSYCLYFAAGIMTFFTVLGWALGMGGLLWGQFFQNETLVTCLLFVVVLLALSLFGLFSLPVFDMKVGTGSQHGIKQAYFTGLLATLLATPCSGPLLGGVLAWVVNQPLLMVFLVFWAVGLGMALPYVILTVFPSASHFLPKPGPWLEIVEKVLAFFLLGTGMYLLSILPQAQHLRLLTALLCACFACWVYGRFCGLGARKTWRRMGLVACCLAVMACLVIGMRTGNVENLWEDYSPEIFDSHLGKEPLFLEFTADWCPNCKFLEATVLTQENMENWRKRFAIRYIRVDLTAQDAVGMSLLQSLGSQSIPLAAIFPVGVEANQPIVLRDVYGKERLEKALEQAMRPAKKDKN